MGGHTLAAMTEPARPTPSTARTTARPRYRATVLVRGDHQLQVGCDPERSLLVELPPTVGAQAVAELLDAAAQILGDHAESSEMIELRRL